MIQKNINEDLNKIFDTISNCLLKSDIEVEIYYRLKDPHSILKKLLRKKIDLHQLKDLVAFRIIVPTTSDCYKTLEVINTCTIKQGALKNFIINPKNNGYQALHTVVAIKPSRRKVELQIRTKEMHEIAELGEANHSKYKNEQEQQVKTSFSQMLNRITRKLKKANNIWKRFRWTETELTAYEHEIKKLWHHYKISK